MANLPISWFPATANTNGDIPIVIGTNFKINLKTALNTLLTGTSRANTVAYIDNAGDEQALALWAAWTVLQSGWPAVAPAWATVLTDPMTTIGDTIYRNGANVTSRLPIGTANQFLRSVWGLPTWQTVSILTNPMTTIGDMIIRDGTNTDARLPVGTAGQVLSVAWGIPTRSTVALPFPFFSTGWISTAYTGTSTWYTNTNGNSVEVDFHVTNGATPTLNINALWALPLQRPDGTAIPAWFVVAGGRYRIQYDSGSNSYKFINDTQVGFFTAITTTTLTATTVNTTTVNATNTNTTNLTVTNPIVAPWINVSVVNKVFADSPYTATATDNTIRRDATGWSVTQNLPTAVWISGKEYKIRKIDSTINTVTIDAAWAETIDGALTVTLVAQRETTVLQSNGVSRDRIA